AGHTFKNSEDKDKLISEILQWYESMMRGKIWRKVRVIFLAICVICVILIPIFWSQTNYALKDPLPIDYEMSWVILTLVSMITLAYVQLINRIRDLFLKDKTKKAFPSEASREKAAWAKVLLSWAGLVLFITILALSIRIALLSFDPEAAEVVRAVKCSDYLTISSFIVGSILRFWVFLEAHWRDLGHFTKNYYNGI
ncbi:MAG: hypothetical protein KAW47_03115, partial [Thermoplasmatales archaeon]|nr:hypothetical protein [Thermoplasmatales archaeon]